MALLALVFISFSLYVGVNVGPETSGTGEVPLVPSGTSRAALTVQSLRPFVVVGRGFHAGEAVRVTVRAEGAAASARDQASAAGRIGVRFRRLKLDKCANYLVVANGNEGSIAQLRSIPRACGVDPGSSP
jgi:hypothetical protein